ncbi:MAG TPA: histidine kinase [Bacteroidetes bacterium]|nr:histidine kinase [Bacteroidota bacterium]
MSRDKNPYTILVIEDNPGDYTLISDYLEEMILTPRLIHLESFGSYKTFCQNEECKADVVLLDLTLPDKYGEELIREVKSLAENIPVIVLTGYADAVFATKSLSLGASDYLVKDEMTPTVLYKSLVYAIERNKNLLILKNSEKLYSDLFHLSPQAMWVYDFDTLFFLDVNEAAVNHYGYSHEEFLAMTILEIRPKEDVHLIQEVIHKLRSGFGEPRVGFYRHKKRDGAVFTVEIRSTQIQFKGKNGVLVLANDISEQLNHLQAIQEQNEKLKEIAWTQSHVVRAPVARILGLIDLIVNDEIPYEEKKVMLAYLLTSANDLDRVIEEVVNKSKAIIPG